MTKRTQQKKFLRNGSAYTSWCLPLITALLICAVVADMAVAQGLPRRGQTLETVNPIAPPPLTSADRVRRDIVDAINPVTGGLDPKKLLRSELFLSSKPYVEGGQLLPIPHSGLFDSSRPSVKGGKLMPIQNSELFPSTKPSIKGGTLLPMPPQSDSSSPSPPPKKGGKLVPIPNSNLFPSDKSGNRR